MKVTVRLVGGLVHTLGFSEREVELEEGATVAQLLEAIGIERGRQLIVGRAGWAIDAADEVRDGDRIMVSPVFSGG